MHTRIIIAVIAIALIVMGFHLDYDIMTEIAHSENPVLGIIRYFLFGWEYVGSWLMSIGSFFLLGLLLVCVEDFLSKEKDGGAEPAKDSAP